MITSPKLEVGLILFIERKSDLRHINATILYIPVQQYFVYCAIISCLLFMKYDHLYVEYFLWIILQDHCYYHGHIDGMEDSSVSVGVCSGIRYGSFIAII